MVKLDDIKRHGNEMEGDTAKTEISCNCYYARCHSCNYMDVKDINEIGECYCKYQKQYYPYEDRTCSHYEQLKTLEEKSYV